jgi:hypothetical protein
MIAVAAEAAPTDLHGLRFVFRALATSPEPTLPIPVREWSAETSLDLVPPLMALPACRPFVVSPRCVHSQTPPQATMAFGPRVPPLDSCSARVVSHHLDGFLRTRVCGFVAPRFRPWGSLRFIPACPAPPKRRWGPARSFPQRGQTLQRVPLVSSRTASLRPLPPCHCRVPEHPRLVGKGSRRTRRHRGGPKSTMAVLWFTEVNLHIAVVRRAIRV